MASLATPDLRSLTLTVTERCNLRCRYCYVPVERGNEMTAEVADAAVDLLLSQAAAQPRISLSFFGGEPFIALGTLRRITERLHRHGRADQQARVVTPTNGLLLKGDPLEFCRREAVELAVSVDGAGGSERLHANGKDSMAELIPLLPGILSLDPAARITARMTVTPHNVDHLATHVRSLARLGFRRIAVQAAFEQPWSEDAIEAWGREHRRIGTWLVGAVSAGVRVPELPSWTAVERRLTLRRPRSACGAGSRVAAVTTDGRVFPCYRFVFDQADDCQLGHVTTGFTNREALELFASLSPDNVRPEQGECASCRSQDGCIHFCPAFGRLALGDPRLVPGVACRLMRAQVEAIRPYASMRARPARPMSPGRWAAAVVVAAAAVSGSAAALGCGGQVTSKQESLPGADAGQDSADGDAQAAGVCAVQVDAQLDHYAGGMCPPEPDAYVGGQCAENIDAQADQYVGGICPYDPDAYVGGQCPEGIDAQPDHYPGGICAYEPDAYVGGKCAEQPDAADATNMGGLCDFIEDASGD